MKKIFLIIGITIALIILFAILLKLPVIPDTKESLQLIVLDKYNVPIRGISVVYFFQSSDQDNIADLSQGHLSNENINEMKRYYTDDLGKVIINKYTHFYKLIEHFKYEAILINFSPVDTTGILEEDYFHFGRGDYLEYFVPAKDNYEMAVILINSTSPNYSKNFSEDGMIRIIDFKRSDDRNDSILINLNYN